MTPESDTSFIVLPDSSSESRVIENQPIGSSRFARDKNNLNYSVGNQYYGAWFATLEDAQEHMHDLIRRGAKYARDLKIKSADEYPDQPPYEVTYPNAGGLIKVNLLDGSTQQIADPAKKELVGVGS